MKKISQFLYGALAIIATALLGTACVDDLSNQFDPMNGVVKIIPYTINATSIDTVTTKVTANIDRKMLFEDNDKLIITGDQIGGTLKLVEKKGTPRGVKGVFRGTLEWKGSGDTPPDDWELNARVISENDELNGLDTFTGAITAETGEAVQKYSLLTGSSTYHDKNFSFSQGTSFIKFAITFEPIPTEGDYPAVVTNENGTVNLATGSVYIDDEGKTEFTLALPGATVLDHAKVTINGIDIKFGGKNQVTLTPGDLYEITRFYSDDLNSPLTFEAAADGVITINIPEEFNVPFTGITYYKNNEAGVLVKGDDPSVAYKTTEIPVVTGDKVTFFGDNDAYNDDKNPITINCTNLCYVYGNVMSLVQSSNFASLTMLPGEETFAGLFSGMKSNNRGDSGSSVIPNHITNHASRKLVLPATRLSICCYQYMFDHCVDWVKAPELPAQNLPDQCYEGMFASCTALTDVYDLTVESVGEASCMEMFAGCTSLINAPGITVSGSTSEAEDAFRHMFTDCINLVNVPDIHIPNLSEEASSCFSSMFEGCTSLVVAPQFDLPLTSNLPGGCFKSAFRHCESLTSPPELPFVNLGVACYSDMFAYCTRLSDAPELPATILPMESYSNMFYYCSNLKHIKCLAKNISAYICLDHWTEGVYPTGLFERDPEMLDWVRNSSSGIPIGWTVDPELPEDDRSTPLTLQATGSGAILIDNPLHYDNIWYTIDDTQYIPGDIDPIEINVSAGQKVCIFGSNATYTSAEGGYNDENDEDGKIWISVSTKIRSTVDCYIYGNIMSLIDPNIFSSLTSLTADYTFRNLFAGNTHLINNSRHLVLPATTLTEQCYENMFKGCTGLTVAPALPATNLDEQCYGHMFDGCTGLTQLPSLPATTLTEDCYEGMFKSCTSITTLPDNFLPATVLNDGCYNNMFKKCTNLVSVPNDLLPATELEGYCYGSMFEGCTKLERAPELLASRTVKEGYDEMFKGCSSLNYIKCLATSLHSDGTSGWVEGVAPTGTFVAAEGMFDWQTGPDGIPQGWVVEGVGTSYSISYNLEHCTLSPSYSVVDLDSGYYTRIKAEDSYRLSSVTVTMGGNDITADCYDEENSTITIVPVTGDVVISATASYTDSYSIDYRLTGATSSNTQTTISSLTSFETKILPVAPANKVNVTVKMGGEDVTYQYWSDYDNTLSIGAVKGDLIITAVGVQVYSVTVQTSYCERSNWDNTVAGGASYDNTFTVYSWYSNYEINDVSVSMGGVDITTTAWNSGTNSVHIDQVTGDLVIHVYASEKGYSVVQNLTNVTSSFADPSVQSGQYFEALLTPDDDYTITSVIVTMGGNDVSYTYNESNRTVEIYSVSGDIEITAVAEYEPDNYHLISYTINNASLDYQPATIHHQATYMAKPYPEGTANTVIVQILQRTGKSDKDWTDVTSQYWDGDSIVIPCVMNDLRITVTGTTLYNINKNLTKCSLTNSASSVTGGFSYDTDVIPNSGWTISEVRVEMGSDDITSTCYNATNHHIGISAVTGEVTITATATGGSDEAVVTYKLQEYISSSNTDTSVTIGKTYETTLSSKVYFKVEVMHNGNAYYEKSTKDESGNYSCTIKISPVEGDITLSAS